MSSAKKKRKALGRGLGALIPEQKAGADAGGARLVPVELISANPYQPRKAFDSAAIADLASSIREHGVIQPLIVSREGSGFQLIAGERRLRAAKLAGLAEVPVIVREEMDRDGALAIALIENIQREDLNPVEEAQAYARLHDEFGLTQAEIAQRVGRDRSTIANALRLLKLPDGVLDRLASGELSVGHARPLLALDRQSEQESIARRIVRDGLSVRQVESLFAEPKSGKKKQKKQKDVFTRDAEEKLTRALRTRVEIERRKRGGTIRVAFSSEDELIRLYEAMAGGRRKGR